MGSGPYLVKAICLRGPKKTKTTQGYLEVVDGMIGVKDEQVSVIFWLTLGNAYSSHIHSVTSMLDPLHALALPRNSIFTV